MAVPACGRVTPRAEEQTEETETIEQNNNQTIEQNNNQTETPRESNSYEHADEAIVGTRELKRALKAARREKYEQAAAVHRDVQRRFIMDGNGREEPIEFRQHLHVGRGEGDGCSCFLGSFRGRHGSERNTSRRSGDRAELAGWRGCCWGGLYHGAKLRKEKLISKLG